MKPKVLVARAIFPETLEKLRRHFDVEDNQSDELWDKPQFASRLADKVGAFTTSQPVDAETLAHAPHLKICANMAVGYNNFDVPAMTARGILATNTPDVLTETTADFGFALVMAIARRVTESEHYLRAGKWTRWSYDMFAGSDVHGSTLNPAKLLKNNGTIDDTQIVHTVRVVPTTDREGDLERTEEYANVVQFLSDDAVRSKNSLDDIDWCSSNNQAICNVRQISIPILVMGTQGHYFIRDQEEIYENSASADKDFVVVEGANHNLGNCTACAAFHGTGPYTNVPLNLWNHVRDWANARF